MTSASALLPRGLPSAGDLHRRAAEGLTPLLVGGAAAVLAAGVALVTPSALVVVVLVLACAWLWFAFTRPLAALTVAVAGIPIDTFHGSGPAGISPAQALVLGCALAGGARWLLQRPLTIAPSAAALGMALLVAATATGLVIAPHPFNPLKQLVNWAAYLVVFQVIVLDGRRDAVQRVLFAFALCGGITGLLAIVAPHAGLTVYNPETGARAAGSFGSPNGLGIFLVLSMFCQLAIALSGPARWRVLCLGAFALSAVGLTLTLSRGSFIGLGVGLVAMSTWPPARRAALIGIVCAVALSAVGSNPVASTLDTKKVVARFTDDRGDYATRSRGDVYHVAPRMFRNHPVFGVGALSFADYAPRYGLPIYGGVFTHAHNVWLTTLVELGLLGITGLLVFAFGVANALRRALRRTVGFDHGLAAALVGCFCALLVSGMVDYPLANANISAMIFVLAACAVSLSRRPAA